MKRLLQITLLMGIILFLYMGVDIFYHLLKGDQVSSTGTWNTNWITFSICIFLFLSGIFSLYLLKDEELQKS